MRTGHLLAILFSSAALLAILSTLAPRRSSVRSYAAPFSAAVSFLYPPPMPPPPPPPPIIMQPPSPPPPSPFNLPQPDSDNAWCPPHRRGAKCDQPAYPACATQWSVPMGNLAPCFYAPSLVVPVSCDCLAQCEEAGHAARIECLLESPIFQPASGLLVDLRNFTPPWSGNPKQLQRTWPELFIRYDPALAARDPPLLSPRQA